MGMEKRNPSFIPVLREKVVHRELPLEHDRVTFPTASPLGLLATTGIGVGAIVGGGILALAGVAFAATGPSAMLPFALNGAIALLTVASFAELAAHFLESGGTYTYARKVLTVEAVFAVG